MSSIGELTIIVAATNRMGIGRGGTLPWTGLKQEMAYFARVTKRTGPLTINAVIMGSKTYLSIPFRFRPLEDRLNIVITRNSSNPAFRGTKRAANYADSFDSAQMLAGSTVAQRRVFVIGGGEIYTEALKRPATKRILLTRILDQEGSFDDCDRFFPLCLGEDGSAKGGWQRKTKEELDAWVGEETPGENEENGVRYVFEMWER